MVSGRESGRAKSMAERKGTKHREHNEESVARRQTSEDGGHPGEMRCTVTSSISQGKEDRSRRSVIRRANTDFTGQGW